MPRSLSTRTRRGLDGDQLTREAVGPIAAAHRALDPGAKLGLRRRITAAADDTEHFTRRLTLSRAARAKQRAQHLALARQSAVTAGRHDRRQALDTLGMLDCDVLRDHAVHPRADDVSEGGANLMRGAMHLRAILPPVAHGFVRVTASRLRMAQHAQPEAATRPRGRATRPTRRLVSLLNLASDETALLIEMVVDLNMNQAPNRCMRDCRATSDLLAIGVADLFIAAG